MVHAFFLVVFVVVLMLVSCPLPVDLNGSWVESPPPGSASA
jgi:hypothetical protein